MAARRIGPPCLSRLRREDGFSFVEVVASIGIFALVMVIMSTMLATGMRGVVLGKQRETATQEMNRLLEVARSLAYENVGLALGDSTIASDPAIVDQAGVKSYLVDQATSLYEPIVWATSPSAEFNPHMATFDRGPSRLTRHVYVTGVDSNGDLEIDYKRVTVRVSWVERGTKGPDNFVRASTFVSASGLVQTPGAATTPLSAETLSLAGTVSIKDDRGSTVPIVDALAPPTTPVVTTAPSSAGNSNVLAVSSTTCTAKSATLQGTSVTYGNKSVTMSVDDDPTSGTPEGPLSQSDPGTFTVASGDDVDLMLSESSLASPVGCQAAAKHTDGVPYERGTASGPASMTFTQDVSGLGLTSNTLYLLKLAGPSTEQSVDHDATSGRRITGTAGGAVGDTQVMSLAGIAPRGLVHIQPFSYQVTASASGGTPPAPTVSVPGGIVLEIYDPHRALPSSACDARTADGYCQKTIDPAAAGFAGYTVSFVDQSVTANLGLTEMKFDVSVSALPPSIKNGVAGANSETLWEASYTAISVSARMRSWLTLDPLLGTKVRLTDAVVDLTLGHGRATGCYGTACLT